MQKVFFSSHRNCATSTSQVQYSWELIDWPYLVVPAKRTCFLFNNKIQLCVSNEDSFIKVLTYSDNDVISGLP